MTDTLSVDTLSLSQWRGNPEFDYPSEFKGSDFSLLDWLSDKFDQIMRELFGDLSLGHTGEIMWYVLGFGAIAAIVVFTLYRHPELLRWRRKAVADDDGYEVVEDNIYGTDFPSAISRALTQGNHREAVRLTYLQTLRLLSDAQLIDWQPAKTPTQYVGEFRDDTFLCLTATFVRVRYGGYAATAQTVDDVTADSKAIAEGIKATALTKAGGAGQATQTTQDNEAEYEVIADQEKGGGK